MPQIVAPKRSGIALDFDLTKTPVNVYLDTRRNNSRAYRGGISDHNNMLLNERRQDNNVNNHNRWKGNGFKGNLQYVTYFGTNEIRPGVKLERDIQINTFPLENSRPLNTTQMGHAADVITIRAPDEAVPEEELRAHADAMRTIRETRKNAEYHEKWDTPHSYFYKPLEENTKRMQRIEELKQGIPGLRTAGLASINPKMGTSGSLPNIHGLQGTASNDAFRVSTPWAIDHSRTGYAHPWPNGPL